MASQNTASAGKSNNYPPPALSKDNEMENEVEEGQDVEIMDDEVIPATEEAKTQKTSKKLSQFVDNMKRAAKRKDEEEDEPKNEESSEPVIDKWRTYEEACEASPNIKITVPNCKCNYTCGIKQVNNKTYVWMPDEGSKGKWMMNPNNGRFYFCCKHKKCNFFRFCDGLPSRYHKDQQPGGWHIKAQIEQDRKNKVSRSFSFLIFLRVPLRVKADLRKV